MESQLKLMGKRLRELRSILDISTAEMARITRVSEEEYLDHEAGRTDSSFTFLYRCAERFGVDASAIVTGEEMPKLNFFNLTRFQNGMPIRRRAGFEYQHMAPFLKNRLAEPFVVKAPPEPEDNPIPLTVHTGQEFDYVLEGKLKVQFDDKIEVLGPGDSVCYDSSHPHGMIAIGEDFCKFLAVVIKSEGEAPVEVAAVGSKEAPAASQELLYKKFMSETLDENGNLTAVNFHYPDNFNFAYDVVDELAARDPNRLAMLHIDRDYHERRFTFLDISRYSQKAANYLTALGVKRGDRVLLVMKRHYQFWFVINALHRIGAVAVPATNQLQTKDFEYRLIEGQITCAICTADGEVAQCVDEAQLKAPGLKTKIIINGTRETWHDFNAEIERYSDYFPRPADVKATDPAIMFFSSGTTGYPKMVEHAMTYPLGHIITARWWHNVQPGGLHLTISDTGWGKALWGKIYGQWLCESAVFVYDFDRFQAADILQLFKKYQITTFCAPPTMYRFFIKEDLANYDLSSLKHANIAGEALNPEVFKEFYKATGLKLMEGFGQTETTLVIANLLGMEPKPGSMGKPSPAYNVELVDLDDQPVGTGEVGEICIRAEKKSVCGLFLGYFRDPEKTNASWHDGLFHTGDTAWRDEDGYYWYVGRRDDLIKSSGYRIGPFEVESVLMELPYVLECAVVGVPDDTRGQLVKAFIVLTKGKTGSDELVKEIQNYVKHHTAPYKYPRKIEFIEAMPKTPSGKIKRNELRSRG